MTLYPDNVREFVTQESVRLGNSGYDIEVEIVRRSNLETTERRGKEVVSIGVKNYCPLPSMEPDDLFVVFDLGTVLDVDDVRFAEPETGTRLPVKKETKRKHRGPLRVPVALTASAGISLLLTAAKRPFGTLTVDIARDGELGEVAFLPEQDAS